MAPSTYYHCKRLEREPDKRSARVGRDEGLDIEITGVGHENQKVYGARFDTGHIAEAFINEDLKAIGARIYNKQAEVVGFAGHWLGHIDGEIDNLPGCEKTMHLLEEKTHNDKNFALLKKTNSVKESFPGHYDQMTSYMGYRKLKRALYVGYNKNTCEYYTERVYFDEAHFKELQHKEMEIITNQELYPKIGTGKPTLNFFKTTLKWPE